MLSSSCSMRFLSLLGVKFLSRLLTALNLLPSIATIASENRLSRRQEHDEFATDAADRLTVVLAEVGGGLKSGVERPSQPHQLNVALRSSRSGVDWTAGG